MAYKKGIIIGAGIGGLSTALALLKKGFDVNIYEQASEIKEVGAGIWVAPNGLRVYDDLGMAGDIIWSGRQLGKITVTDTNNKAISVIDNDKVKLKHKYGTVAIHRATLQNILASGIRDKIIPGKKFVSYTQSENGVNADFSDGTKVSADFLIVADGIHSNGRKQMLNSTETRYSGQTCWRFVTDFDLPQADENNMYEIWGSAKGLRAAYSKINERQVYCYITTCAKAGGKDNLQTIKKYLKDLCAEFQPVIRELIDACDAKDIIRTDLSDFKPVSKWTDGRVALLGDAAHATTPNLGQGACQSIEDAWVIADELSRNENISEAFLNYQNRRIKKATHITNTSFQFARITNTSGLLKSLIKGFIRMTPESVSAKQFDRIYSTDF